MASNDFSLRLITDEWSKATKEMDRLSQRAAMWAVRESARKVSRAAAKVAPVYRGPARKVRVDGKLIPLVPGEYKKSIKSSRRFSRSATGTYSLKVGPRGGHVHLYAQKIEARTQPMGTAYSQLRGQVEGIHEGAMKRALRKYAK